MTRTEAMAVLAELSAKLDPTTDSMAAGIAQMLDNPALPMLMRVQAMATVIGGAAEGLSSIASGDVDGGDLGRIHLIERLPDIILALKASVDLLEDANKGRRH